nr:MAG TPA: hypothetical protein [Caudoviricetes sp.]
MSLSYKILFLFTRFFSVFTFFTIFLISYFFS